MMYLFFAVLLVISNVLTFRFTAKWFSKAIIKEVKSWDKNRTVRRSGKYRSVNYSIPRQVGGEYVFDNRDDATHVLSTLTEVADRYGMVSVGDYYDLIKVTSEFTDNSYGWDKQSLSEARINISRDGLYVIKFPPVEMF